MSYNQKISELERENLQLKLELEELKKGKYQKANFKQQKLLEQILNEIPVGIALHEGPEFVTTVVNRSYYDFAYGRGNVIGRKVADVWPEVADQIIPLLTGVYKTGEPYHANDAEFILDRGKGPERAWFSFSYLPFKGDTDKVTGILVWSFESTSYVLNRLELEKSHEKLQKSEEKFRAIFEQADVGIGRVSFHDAKWFDVNAAFCEMLGYSAREFKLTPWTQITHPDDIEIDLIPFKKMAAGELENYSVEKRFIHKKGHYVWAHLTLSLVRDNNGHPDYEIAVIENITERKQVEEALQRSEERWNLALEYFAVGAIIATENEQVIYWNPAAREMHGFTKPDEGIEPLEKTPVTFQLWTPDGNHMLELDEWPMRRIKRGEIIRNYELRLRRPDQDWEKYVSYSGVMLETAIGEKLIFLTVHDLTEQWKSKEALRESEEHFRTMANNISQLAWMADEKGEVFWYNKRWYDYTGTTLDEMRGRGWKKVHHPDHIDRVLKSIQHSLDKGIVLEEIFPLRGKDGNYRWFLTRAIPIKDYRGNLVKWFGTNTDITEHREQEVQLKKTRDLFENILYIMAHDLKGPLANMHMATNLIQSVDDMDKKMMLINNYKPMLERMDSTIKGVTDILEVQQTEGSSAVSIDMEILINNLLLEFKDDLKTGELNYDFKGKRYVKYIEPFLLSILRNLVSNAVKYRQEDVPLKIYIKTEGEGRFTLLSVEDNGIGMDLEKYKEQLFTPFMRIGFKKTEGTGIGLYIIKNIIEKNGGYITVESTPGKGTKFNCYLKEYF